LNEWNIAFEPTLKINMMLTYENRPAMGQATSTTSDHLPIPPSSSSTTMTNGISNTSQPDTKHHHIWLITGPAGCGKSTVAQYIAKAMNLPFMEGDEVFNDFRYSTYSC
jgi:gluconokinase